MSEDRSVHTDALATLGSIISASEQRDAIHLAVEPVIAKERLRAGYHVGADGTRQNPVGIVDPFLTVGVEPGERFWLILYPRTITSLRHVWEHPLFPAALAATPSASELWMRAWAMEHMPDDLGRFVESNEDGVYAFAVQAGHDHDVGPCEDARDHIDAEWWGHWEAITGKKGDRDSGFRCGC